MKNSLFVILVTCLFLGGCSVNKYVPAGQSLYVGSKVNVQPDTISKPNVSGVADQLEGLVKPPPNATLFGFAWKVWFYYWIGEPKDEGGLRSWFRDKLGEEPRFATERVADINAANMVSFLDNEGYYRSSVQGKIVNSKKQKRRTATMEFDAYVMPRYVINEISYMVPDSSLFNRDLVKAKEKTVFRKGDPIRLDVVTTERTRIDQELKGKGYYFFNPDYLIVKIDSTIGRADSTLGPQQVNVFLEVKKETAQTSLKQYFINNIFVNTGTEENQSADTVVTSRGRLRRGIQVTDPGKLYKRRIFYDAIGFRRGNMYTNTMHEVSLSRLVNLQNFRFVKNRFDLVPRSDSALLDVYYDLAPMKKKSLQTTLSASTKSNNLGGSQLDVTWRNRNTFKGAEMLSVNAYFGFDVQLGGNRAEATSDFRKIGNEYIRYGARADLSFPRFIIPFSRIRPEKSQALPKTILSLNYENRVQRGLYTTTSIRADWSYVWSKKSEVVHTLTPFSINYVQTGGINTENLDKIIFNPSTNPLDIDRIYKIIDAKYFIAGSNYSISYRPTPRPFSKNQFALTGGLDYGGNLLSLFAKRPLPPDDTLPKEFLKVPVFQYVKVDGDIRYYRTLTPSIKWANRLLVGMIKPYGNSRTMPTPQFKQYFGGGSTGIRAFRARSLGPGAVEPDTASFALLGYQQFADIRLEFNTEFRIKFTNIINGAVFMDAGNIWSFGDTARIVSDSRALISKDFMKQVAVGGGIGLRLDFSFLVFRLDVATPFRKPWYTQYKNVENPDGPYLSKSPWVFNEINFRSKAWRRENLILNIAVGLPF
ncbi:Outer membrane protein assembly factor BamA [Dyadobacter sp. CECT 9623]|uniref:Outer membrane protein assembly factor BamA n=1 Tax=Dyadobacter linearis TaxID=2823330 RepID=A0ABM8US36_9BACT|nr:BamA/TamA family outer membrane protein [Dyadobacter sp. CECT 9623]CAG5070494.1 Outer membrane protein assembly factor BamA [Dyadobacter sp. CECT 9623]